MIFIIHDNAHHVFEPIIAVDYHHGEKTARTDENSCGEYLQNIENCNGTKFWRENWFKLVLVKNEGEIGEASRDLALGWHCWEVTITN